MKPIFLSGYPADHARDCERLLVSLLRGVGPLRDSIFLIGGLTPRYLVKKRPPEVRPHAGTLDVDVVLDVQLLANTEAYRTLEENFKHIGLERGTNDNHARVSWRWVTRTASNAVLMLELLTDDLARGGGRVQEIKGEGGVSALNVPNSSIVFDFHETVEVTAELLGNNGKATVTVRHADIVSFTTLKANAFADRNERKDAHDLIYCLQHFEGGLEAAAPRFITALKSKHSKAVRGALNHLGKSFTTYGGVEGYEREGPVAAAKFESQNQDETSDETEIRILRQREASDTVERLLAQLT